MEDITVELIKEIVKTTPNDMDLGAKLRALFNQKINGES